MIFGSVVSYIYLIRDICGKAEISDGIFRMKFGEFLTIRFNVHSSQLTCLSRSPTSTILEQKKRLILHQALRHFGQELRIVVCFRHLLE